VNRATVTALPSGALTWDTMTAGGGVGVGFGAAGRVVVGRAAVDRGWLDAGDAAEG